MITADLIIFDCDGTLVDSEHLNNKATADVLASVGAAQYDTEYCLRHFAGKSLNELTAFVQADAGIRLPDDFIAQYAALVMKRMDTELRVIAGVDDTIAHFFKNIPICVGSNGERNNVLKSLRLTKLNRFFPDDAVFTASMVKHPKPAPDLFLLAAERMGVDPAKTVVIEDSITGTKAGVAAGMTVIGFTGTYHEAGLQADNLRQAGAAVVIHDFTELLSILDTATRKLSTGT